MLNMPHLDIENNAKIWEFGNMKFLVIIILAYFKCQLYLRFGIKTKL